MATSTKSDTYLRDFAMNSIFCQDFICIDQQDCILVHRWHTRQLANQVVSINTWCCMVGPRWWVRCRHMDRLILRLRVTALLAFASFKFWVVKSAATTHHREINLWFLIFLGYFISTWESQGRLLSFTLVAAADKATSGAHRLLIASEFLVFFILNEEFLTELLL